MLPLGWLRWGPACYLAVGLGLCAECPRAGPTFQAAQGWLWCQLPQGTSLRLHLPCCAVAELQELQGEEQCGEELLGRTGVTVCHVGSPTVAPEPAVSPSCGQAWGSTPCSRLRLWCSEMGAARGQQCLTAPCFWQVPASSTTASSCWSARIRPWPGPLPAACPRSPVSHPWPSPASSSWRSSRSGMRAKKPCQVSSPGRQPLAYTLPRAWGSHLAARARGDPGSAPVTVPLPVHFSQGSPILTLALYPSIPLQIKTSLRWTSEFPAPRLQAMAGPVSGPRGVAGTVTSWLQPSLMLGMDV